MPRTTNRPSTAPLPVQRGAPTEHALAEPRQAWRDEPVERKLAFARREGSELGDDLPERFVDLELERILGSADFLPGAWLRRGGKVCDAVARVRAGDCLGTGFLVSPWLLMTNQHVLSSPDRAAATMLDFRYEEDRPGRITRSVELVAQPERCFVWSPEDELDYALIAVAPAAAGRPPGKAFGTIPLRGELGKALKGQPVNVVQHPEGRPREIAVRENSLIGVDDAQTLTYETDTCSGSSGAPVLTDRWELIALHSRSVQAVDAQGRHIDVDGRPVDASTPERSRRWVANKGIRVSAIVADLRTRAVGPDHGTEAAALVAELLAHGGNR